MTMIARMVTLCLVLLAAPASAATNGMSIDCATSKEPFAPIVCGSRFLSAIDRRITELYKGLTDTLTGRPLQDVKAAQARWWKTRARCVTADDPKQCSTENFHKQLALLLSYSSHPDLSGTSPLSGETYESTFGVIDLKIGFLSADDVWAPSEEELEEKALSLAKSFDPSAALRAEAILRVMTLWVAAKHHRDAIALYQQTIASTAWGDHHHNLKVRFHLAAARANQAIWASQAANALFDMACGPEWDCKNRQILEDDAATVAAVNWIGLPEAVRRQRASQGAEAREEIDAIALRIRQEEAAEKAAAEREQARLLAEAQQRRREAEEARQRQIDEANAAEKARQATARAAEEAEARRLHRTFGYQARLLGGAFVDSLKLIWAFVPFWVYPVAAALGWLSHHHVALRIAFGGAAFAVIAYAAVYAGPMGGLLPGAPASLLASVWQAWTAYNPDIDRTPLAGNIVFTYVPVAVIAYCLTLAFVGRNVRAAEAYRLRGFLPEWLRSWRYGFAQWRAERSERRRMLRDAKFQARLAAIQATGVPGNYAMAGSSGGVPVVRLQRTLGDHIRVFGSVMGVLLGAGTLLFSWYVWYTDSASSWLAWIGQAIWRSMKQEAGW